MPMLKFIMKPILPFWPIAVLMFAISFGQTWAALEVTAYPMGMRKQGDAIALSWTGGADRVHIRASSIPGGQAGKYDSLHLPSQLATGSYSFRINPDIPLAYRATDLRIGVNYCVLSDGTQQSKEFVLIIESSQAPLPKSPVNAISLQDPAPTFSWTGQAPYYTMLVSDEPFRISDSGTVSGISAIWQILTPFASARYGDADPSGLSGIQAPPLVAGKTYNWLVLNNYTGTSSGTSQVASTPQSFTYTPITSLTAPTLIVLKDNDTLKAVDIIDFSWNPSAGAVSYKIELLEENQVAGSQADLVVWKATVTAAKARLSGAASLLRRYRYKWRVYALDDQGAAAVSVKRTFFYDIAVANLNLKLRNAAGAGIAYAPVRVSRLGAAASSVYQSSSTDATGTLEVQNAPLGLYELKFENIPGYVARTDTLRHPGPGNTSATITLSPAAGRLNGRVQTASSIGIQAAKVVAVNSQGMATTATTNSQGDYQLSLPLGAYNVTATAEGYEAKTQAVSLGVATPDARSDFNLTAKTSALAVTVVNAFTRKTLLGAKVAVTQGGITSEKFTDGSGLARFTLSAGEAAVSASAAGFASATPLRVQTSSAQNLSLGLEPGASLISGRVRDAQKTSLAQSTVRAVPSQGLSLTTQSDGQGYYELNLGPGEWKVSAVKAGYSSLATLGFTLESGRTLQDMDLTLSANPSWVAGRTTVQGQGIASVTVTSQGNSTLSDASGYFRLSLPAGSHTLKAEKTGYLFSAAENIALNAGDSVVGLTLSGSANAGSVQGLVQASGKPVALAQVILASGSALTANETRTLATTDLEGRFQMPAIPGAYRIWSHKEGFLAVDTLSLQVLAGNPVSGLTLNLNRYEVRLRGQVRHGATPLSGCLIAYQGLSSAAVAGNTLSDASGIFAIGVTPNQAYRVQTRCAGFVSQSAETKPAANGQEISLDFSMPPALAQWAGELVTVAGAPLAGVAVSAQSGSQSANAITGADGRYVLDLGTGTWSLVFSKSGYREGYRNLSVPWNGTPQSKDTLKAAIGRLSVRVVEGTKGLSQTLVRLLPLDGGSAKTATTDAEGRLDLGLLAAGQYQVSAEKSGYQTKTQNATLAADATVNIQLDLVAQSAVIAGKVTAQGQAKASITVSLTGIGLQRFAVSGADGSYAFTGLPAGRYALKAYAEGFVSEKSLDSLQLAAAENRNAADLSVLALAASLQGRLTGADNPSGFPLRLTGRTGFRASTQTDAQGRFQFSALPNDHYVLQSARAGYAVTGTIGNAGLAIDKSTDLDVTVQAASFSVTGVLKDQSGKPVGGVAVLAVKSSGDAAWQGEVITNEQGAFTLTAIPLGDAVRMGCRSQVGLRECRDTVLTSGLTHGANVAVSLLAVDRRSQVTGTLALGNDALVGTTLRLKGLHNDANAFTASGGRFAFAGVAGGSALSLLAEVRGAKRLDTLLNLALGEKIEGLFLTLPSRQPQVKIRLLTTAGKVLSGIRIGMREGNLTDTVITDGAGIATFAAKPAYSSQSVGPRLNANEYDAKPLEFKLGENDTTLEIRVVARRTRITVRTRDESDRALDDAVLWLNGKESGKTRAGQIEFTGLAEGEYILAATKSGHTGAQASRMSLSGDTSVTVTLQLPSLNQGISGTITDSVFGSDGFKVRRAMAGLTVELEIGNARRSTRTDASGYFAFANVPVGQATLSVAAAGHAHLLRNVTVTGTLLSQDLLLTAIPGTLTGRVEGTDRAWVKAVQSNGLRTLSVETDEDGWFSLTGLSADQTYFVQAGSRNDSISASTPTTLFVLKNAAQGLTFQVKRSAQISAKVRQGESDVVIPGAIVWLLRSGRRLAVNQANNQGQIVFAGLEDGTYTLVAELTGYHADTVQGLTPNESAAISPANAQTVLRLKPAAPAIAGRVTDSRGQGLSALIELLPPNGNRLTTSSDGEGFFNFQANANGRYSLSATKRGFQTTRIPDLEYTASSHRFIPVVLRMADDSLTLLVKDAATDKPLPVVQAVLQFENGSDSAMGDSAGLVALAWQGNQTGRLSVAAEDYLGVDGMVVKRDTLAAGLLSLHLTPDYRFDGSIQVTVRDQGQPVAGAVIELRSLSGDDSPLMSVTGAAANLFQGLRYPAEYRVTIRRDGHDELKRVIRLTRQEKSISLVMAYPSSRMSLQLTSDGKKPRTGIVRGNGQIWPEGQKAGLYTHPERLGASSMEMQIETGDALNLVPEALTLSVGEDTLRTDSLAVPFYASNPGDTTLGSTVTFKVNRQDANEADPGDVCTLYVKPPQAAWQALAMSSEQNGFSIEYDANQRAGEYLAYFTARKLKGLKTAIVSGSNKSHVVSPVVYSNRNQPLRMRLRDPKVLTRISLLPASAENDTLRYDLSGEDRFQVQVFGEAEMPLNAFIDELTKQPDTAYPLNITWRFLDPEKAEAAGLRLAVSDSTPRLCAFAAGAKPSGGAHGLEVAVKLGAITLRKQWLVRVEDLTPTHIGIRLAKDGSVVSGQPLPLAIANTSLEGYRFEAFAQTADGTQYRIQPRWTLGADSAAGTLTQDGLFLPRAGVAREAVLSIYDTLRLPLAMKAFSAQATLRTEAYIAPADTGMLELSDGEGLQLAFPLGGLAKAFTVSVSRPPVNPLLRASPTQEVVGDVHEIELSEAQPFKPDSGALLRLPIAPGMARRHKVFVGHWNATRLSWELLDSAVGDTVAVSRVSHFSKYAVIMGSLPLGAYDFEVKPNPFTPKDPWGLQFQYTLSSEVSSQVGVRIEVFNLLGDKVYVSREVLVSKGQTIAPGTYKADPQSPRRREELGPYLWDGRDQKGAICRNGRYLLRLIVRDGKESREYLRKVVLIQ